MKHRLLAVTIALVALAATAPAAQAGFGSSPGRTAPAASAANAFGDWIDDVERPPKGYR